MCKMENLLIRTRDYEERGMFVKAIYGLNIFVTNEQAIEVGNDPRVEFMRALGDTRFRVAHVGDMALEGDEPQDYFTAETWNSQRVVTSVGLYNDAFYASPHDNGYVFFDVPPAFWTTQVDKSRSGGINYVIGDDSLAMYIHGDGSPIVALKALLDEPFPNVSLDTLSKAKIITDWIDRITTLFDYCAVTVADGWHTLIYSRNPIDSDFVDATIAATRNKITSSEWYKTHKDELTWEDRFAKCLVTPEILSRFQELAERDISNDA